MPESLHLVLPVLQTYLPPDANASVALRTAAIFPVHFQADGLAIRIYLDIRQRIPAGHIPPAGDMNHRLFRPFRLIKVESILPYLTVVRDQPLVVHPRHISLVARRAGKIEHVPDERTPRETAALDGIVVCSCTVACHSSGWNTPSAFGVFFPVCQ